ncbi:MAG: PQQ-binding-like beta-propeller repeat protein [Dehalococcoidia bacterium]
MKINSLFVLLFLFVPVACVNCGGGSEGENQTPMVDAKSGLADTSWPMFGHDLRHTGRSEYSGPDEAILKWKYQAKTKLDFEIGEGISILEPVSSSAAIGEDGTVYFGSQASGINALNPDGSKKWDYSASPYVQSSPAIGRNGEVYFGSDGGYLYALNQDGSLKWRFKTGNSIKSSPAIDKDGIIYFGSDDGYLYALNQDGSLKWLFKTGGRIKASPAIGENGIIYFGSDDCHFYAIGK